MINVGNILSQGGIWQWPCGTHHTVHIKIALPPRLIAITGDTKMWQHLDRKLMISHVIAPMISNEKNYVGVDLHLLIYLQEGTIQIEFVQNHLLLLTKIVVD